MTQNGYLAISIVNFNSGHHIIKCLELVETLPSTKLVCVTDNNSVDSSIDFLRSLSKKSKIRLLENSENVGFAKAHNQILNCIDTSYVLLLNPDCQINANAIQRLETYLSNNPSVGMAGPLVLNEDGTEQRGCRREEPTPLKTFKTLFGNREKGINQVGSPLPDDPVEVDAISGACMLIRREALKDVGPLDEGYFLHFEDLDWCKRFWLKGWRVMFVPDAIITHFKGGSSRSRPVRVEWHKHKGMVRYYRKFYSDRYPNLFLWAVYGVVWVRFALMIPVWWLRGLRE